MSTNSVVLAKEAQRKADDVVEHARVEEGNYWTLLRYSKQNDNVFITALYEAASACEFASNEWNKYIMKLAFDSTEDVSALITDAMQMISKNKRTATTHWSKMHGAISRLPHCQFV